MPRFVKDNSSSLKCAAEKSHESFPHSICGVASIHSYGVTVRPIFLLFLYIDPPVQWFRITLSICASVYGYLLLALGKSTLCLNTCV